MKRAIDDPRVRYALEELSKVLSRVLEEGALSAPAREIKIKLEPFKKKIFVKEVLR